MSQTSRRGRIVVALAVSIGLMAPATVAGAATSGTDTSVFNAADNGCMSLQTLYAPTSGTPTGGTPGGTPGTMIGPVVNGRVTDANSMPLVNALVVSIAEDGTPLGCTQTGFDGQYSNLRVMGKSRIVATPPNGEMYAQLASGNQIVTVNPDVQTYVADFVLAIADIAIPFYFSESVSIAELAKPEISSAAVRLNAHAVLTCLKNVETEEVLVCGMSRDRSNTTDRYYDVRLSSSDIPQDQRPSVGIQANGKIAMPDGSTKFVQRAFYMNDLPIGTSRFTRLMELFGSQPNLNRVESDSNWAGLTLIPSRLDRFDDGCASLQPLFNSGKTEPVDPNAPPAYEGTMTGVVTDSNNQPIPGALLISLTGNGSPLGCVQTNLDGSYGGLPLLGSTLVLVSGPSGIQWANLASKNEFINVESSQQLIVKDFVLGTANVAIPFFYADSRENSANAVRLNTHAMLACLQDGGDPNVKPDPNEGRLYACGIARDRSNSSAPYYDVRLSTFDVPSDRAEFTGVYAFGAFLTNEGVKKDLERSFLINTPPFDPSKTRLQTVSELFGSDANFVTRNESDPTWVGLVLYPSSNNSGPGDTPQEVSNPDAGCESVLPFTNPEYGAAAQSTVGGRVTDSNSNPVEGAIVIALDLANGGKFLGCVPTNADGFYSGLPATGVTRIVVTGPSGSQSSSLASASDQFEPIAGENYERDYMLPVADLAIPTTYVPDSNNPMSSIRINSHLTFVCLVDTTSGNLLTCGLGRDRSDSAQRYYDVRLSTSALGDTNPDNVGLFAFSEVDVPNMGRKSLERQMMFDDRPSGTTRLDALRSLFGSPSNLDRTGPNDPAWAVLMMYESGGGGGGGGGQSTNCASTPENDPSHEYPSFLNATVRTPWGEPAAGYMVELRAFWSYDTYSIPSSSSPSASFGWVNGWGPDASSNIQIQTDQNGQFSLCRLMGSYSPYRSTEGQPNGVPSPLASVKFWAKITPATGQGDHSVATTVLVTNDQRDCILSSSEVRCDLQFDTLAPQVEGYVRIENGPDSTKPVPGAMVEFFRDRANDPSGLYRWYDDCCPLFSLGTDGDGWFGFATNVDQGTYYRATVNPPDCNSSLPSTQSEPTGSTGSTGNSNCEWSGYASLSAEFVAGNNAAWVGSEGNTRDFILPRATFSGFLTTWDGKPLEAMLAINNFNCEGWCPGQNIRTNWQTGAFAAALADGTYEVYPWGNLTQPQQASRFTIVVQSGMVTFAQRVSPGMPETFCSNNEDMPCPQSINLRTGQPNLRGNYRSWDGRPISAYVRFIEECDADFWGDCNSQDVNTDWQDGSFEVALPDGNFNMRIWFGQYGDGQELSESDFVTTFSVSVFQGVVESVTRTAPGQLFQVCGGETGVSCDSQLLFETVEPNFVGGLKTSGGAPIRNASLKLCPSEEPNCWYGGSYFYTNYDGAFATSIADGEFVARIEWGGITDADRQSRFRIVASAGQVIAVSRIAPGDEVPVCGGDSGVPCSPSVTLQTAQPNIEASVYFHDGAAVGLGSLELCAGDADWCDQGFSFQTDEQGRFYAYLPNGTFTARITGGDFVTDAERAARFRIVMANGVVDSVTRVAPDEAPMCGADWISCSIGVMLQTKKPTLKGNLTTWLGWGVETALGLCDIAATECYSPDYIISTDYNGLFAAFIPDGAYSVWVLSGSVADRVSRFKFVVVNGSLVEATRTAPGEEIPSCGGTVPMSCEPSFYIRTATPNFRGVLENGSGQPLSDTVLEIACDSQVAPCEYPYFSASTDGAGEFAEYLPDGTYSVRITETYINLTGADWKSRFSVVVSGGSVISVVRTEPGNPEPMCGELDPCGGFVSLRTVAPNVTGILRSASGAAIKWVSLSFIECGVDATYCYPSSFAETDWNGAFTDYLFDGTYNVKIDSRNVNDAERLARFAVVVAGGQVISASRTEPSYNFICDNESSTPCAQPLVLEIAPPNFFGTLLSSSGSPLEAILTLCDYQQGCTDYSNWLYVSTNEEGLFEAVLPNGDYSAGIFNAYGATDSDRAAMYRITVEGDVVTRVLRTAPGAEAVLCGDPNSCSMGVTLQSVPANFTGFVKSYDDYTLYSGLKLCRVDDTQCEFPHYISPMWDGSFTTVLSDGKYVAEFQPGYGSDTVSRFVIDVVYGDVIRVARVSPGDETPLCEGAMACAGVTFQSIRPNFEGDLKAADGYTQIVGELELVCEGESPTCQGQLLYTNERDGSFSTFLANGTYIASIKSGRFGSYYGDFLSAADRAVRFRIVVDGGVTTEVVRTEPNEPVTVCGGVEAACADGVYLRTLERVVNFSGDLRSYDNYTPIYGELELICEGESPTCQNQSVITSEWNGSFSTFLANGTYIASIKWGRFDGYWGDYLTESDRAVRFRIVVDGGVTTEVVRTEPNGPVAICGESTYLCSFGVPLRTMQPIRNFSGDLKTWDERPIIYASMYLECLEGASSYCDQWVYTDMDGNFANDLANGVYEASITSGQIGWEYLSDADRLIRFRIMVEGGQVVSITQTAPGSEVPVCGGDAPSCADGIHLRTVRPNFIGTIVSHDRRLITNATMRLECDDSESSCEDVFVSTGYSDNKFSASLPNGSYTLQLQSGGYDGYYGSRLTDNDLAARFSVDVVDGVVTKVARKSGSSEVVLCGGDIVSCADGVQIETAGPNFTGQVRRWNGQAVNLPQLRIECESENDGCEDRWIYSSNGSNSFSTSLADGVYTVTIESGYDEWWNYLSESDRADRFTVTVTGGRVAQVVRNAASEGFVVCGEGATSCDDGVDIQTARPNFTGFVQTWDLRPIHNANLRFTCDDSGASCDDFYIYSGYYNNQFSANLPNGTYKMSITSGYYGDTGYNLSDADRGAEFSVTVEGGQVTEIQSRSGVRSFVCGQGAGACANVGLFTVSPNFAGKLRSSSGKLIQGSMYLDCDDSVVSCDGKWLYTDMSGSFALALSNGVYTASINWGSYIGTEYYESVTQADLSSRFVITVVDGAVVSVTRTAPGASAVMCDGASDCGSGNLELVTAGSNLTGSIISGGGSPISGELHFSCEGGCGEYAVNSNSEGNFAANLADGDYTGSLWWGSYYDSSYGYWRSLSDTDYATRFLVKVRDGAVVEVSRTAPGALRRVCGEEALSACGGAVTLQTASPNFTGDLRSADGDKPIYTSLNLACSPASAGCTDTWVYTSSTDGSFSANLADGTYVATMSWGNHYIDGFWTSVSAADLATRFTINVVNGSVTKVVRTAPGAKTTMCADSDACGLGIHLKTAKANLKGKLQTSSGTGIQASLWFGCTVESCEDQSIYTDNNGAFAINLPDGVYETSTSGYNLSDIDSKSKFAVRVEGGSVVEVVRIAPGLASTVCGPTDTSCDSFDQGVIPFQSAAPNFRVQVRTDEGVLVEGARIEITKYGNGYYPWQPFGYSETGYEVSPYWWIPAGRSGIADFDLEPTTTYRIKIDRPWYGTTDVSPIELIVRAEANAADSSLDVYRCAPWNQEPGTTPCSAELIEADLIGTIDDATYGRMFTLTMPTANFKATLCRPGRADECDKVRNTSVQISKLNEYPGSPEPSNTYKQWDYVLNTWVADSGDFTTSFTTSGSYKITMFQPYNWYSGQYDTDLVQTDIYLDVQVDGLGRATIRYADADGVATDTPLGTVNGRYVLRYVTPNLLGTVVDPTGNSGAQYSWVEVYRGTANGLVWFSGVSANKDGEYSLYLPNGNYTVRANPSSSAQGLTALQLQLVVQDCDDDGLGELYAGDASACGAEPAPSPLQLDEGRLNMILVESQFVGTLYNPTTSPKSVAPWSSYHYEKLNEDGNWEWQNSWGYTNQAGRFGVNFPDEGTYRVWFEVPWYLSSEVATARVVVNVVENGGTLVATPDIGKSGGSSIISPTPASVGNWDVSLARPNVSGFIKSNDGTRKIGSAWINVQKWYEAGSMMCYGSSSGCWNWSNEANGTSSQYYGDNLGFYALSLPQGKWRLQVNPPYGEFDQTMTEIDVLVDANGKVCLATAGATSCTGDGIAPGSFDINLGAPNFTGYVVTETFTPGVNGAPPDNWDPLYTKLSRWSSIRFEKWDAQNKYWSWVPVWAQTNFDGFFSQNLREDGVYRIAFDPSWYLQDYSYTTKYLAVCGGGARVKYLATESDVADFECSDFTMGSMSTKVSSQVLLRGANVKGIVVDGAAAPIGDVWVSVSKCETSPWSGEWCYWVKGVGTRGTWDNANLGEFGLTIDNETLTPAKYRFDFYPPWYSGAGLVHKQIDVYFADFVPTQDGTEYCVGSLTKSVADGGCDSPRSHADTEPWQVALTGGNLAGKVVTPDADCTIDTNNPTCVGMAGAWLSVEKWNVLPWNVSNYGWTWEPTSAYSGGNWWEETSANGNFGLDISTPGLYRVTVNPSWYNPNAYARTTYVITVAGNGNWCVNPNVSSNSLDSSKANPLALASTCTPTGTDNESDGILGFTARLGGANLKGVLYDSLTDLDLQQNVVARKVTYAWMSLQKKVTWQWCWYGDCKDYSYWQWVSSSSTSGAAGSEGEFGFSVNEPGDYRIEVYPQWGNTNAASQFSVDFTVTEPGVLPDSIGRRAGDKYLLKYPSPNFVGTVYDKTWPNGGSQKVGGAWISVYDANTQAWAGGMSTTWDGAEKGNFSLLLNNPGEYRVEVYPPWDQPDAGMKRTYRAFVDTNLVVTKILYGESGDSALCDNSGATPCGSQFNLSLLGENVTGRVYYPGSPDGTDVANDAYATATDGVQLAMPWAGLQVLKCTGSWTDTDLNCDQWVTWSNADYEGKLRLALDNGIYRVQVWPNTGYFQSGVLETEIDVSGGAIARWRYVGDVADAPSTSYTPDFGRRNPNVNVTIAGVADSRFVQISTCAAESITDADATDGKGTCVSPTLVSRLTATYNATTTTWGVSVYLEPGTIYRISAIRKTTDPNPSVNSSDVVQVTGAYNESNPLVVALDLTGSS